MSLARVRLACPQATDGSRVSVGLVLMAGALILAPAYVVPVLTPTDQAESPQL